MLLVPALRTIRSIARTALAPCCAAVATYLALSNRTLPHANAAAWATLALGAVAAASRIRDRARRRRAHETVAALDGGTAVILVAAAYVVVYSTGRLPASPANAVPVLVMALVGALAASSSAAIAVTLALATETAAYLREKHYGMTDLAIRSAALLTAALAHYLLTSLEIRRVREHARKLLEEERNKQNEAARSFRLIGARSGTQRSAEAEDDRRVRGSLDEIRESTVNLLRIARGALGLHTCALYWLDARRQHLRFVAADSAVAETLERDAIPVGAGAVGGACAMAKNVLLSKIRKDYTGLTYYPGAAPVHAFAAVPVMEKGEVRGVLVADRVEDRPFDGNDESVLATVAQQSLRHVHNERVFGILEKTKDELAKLFTASRTLGEALTEDQVISAVAHSIRTVVEHDTVVVTTFEPKAREHRVRFADGSAASRLRGLVFAPNTGIASAAAETRHALPHRGHFDSRTQYVFTREIDFSDCQSVLCLPLVVRDHSIGTLTLAARRRGAFPDATRQLLGVLAGHAAVALSNAAAVRRLEELATTDPMTGLLNKRSLETEFDKRLRSATRFSRPLSVLVMDIDKFKSVNDTYGHGVGDIVIKGLGAILVARRRETDAVARFGGEEFVIVCEETGLDGAWLLAERIREELRATVFHTEQGPLSVTCSIGIAEFPRDGETRESLFTRADEALYEAKRGGRNQTRIAGKRQPPVVAPRRDARTGAAAPKRPRTRAAG